MEAQEVKQRVQGWPSHKEQSKNEDLGLCESEVSTMSSMLLCWSFHDFISQALIHSFIIMPALEIKGHRAHF